MHSLSLPVRRIVSGGQTGVDRGALDAAIALGIEHGGWCPQGRRAEDGTIPPQYDLKMTESPDYAVRTRQNVADSDGTLIFYRQSLTGGTRAPHRYAVRSGRPYHLVRFDDSSLSATEEGCADRRAMETVAAWLVKNEVAVLNVAGPRESLQPGIAAATTRFLIALLRPEHGGRGEELPSTLPV